MQPIGCLLAAYISCLYGLPNMQTSHLLLRPQYVSNTYTFIRLVLEFSDSSKIWCMFLP